MRERILYYAIKYKGEYTYMKKALHNKEPYTTVQYNGNYICMGDSNYPKAFDQLKEKPLIIFYEGDITLLDRRCISIVGSRQMSDLGRRYCEVLLAQLNSKYVTISGLAKGVDGYIHQLSLAKRNTIGVIGCGLDVIYPKCNAYLYQEMRKHHLIVSEYPNGAQPFAYHFPRRNRLLAALGQKLIVIEASIKSGTLLTVNEALLLDKEIYCFPYPFLEDKVSGCNMLIQEGASVLVDISMIKEL